MRKSEFSAPAWIAAIALVVGGIAIAIWVVNDLNDRAEAKQALRGTLQKLEKESKRSQQEIDRAAKQMRSVLSASEDPAGEHERLTGEGVDQWRAPEVTQLAKRTARDMGFGDLEVDDVKRSGNRWTVRGTAGRSQLLVEINESTSESGRRKWTAGKVKKL